MKKQEVHTRNSKLRGANFLAAKSQQRLSEVGIANGMDGRGVSTIQIRLKARSITFCG